MKGDERAEDRQLLERLRALRVDPPGGEFQTLLRQKLVAAGPPQRVSPWRRLVPQIEALRWGWGAVGLAAGVAIFLALSTLHGKHSGPEGLITRLPETQVALVRLNLTADVAVQAAQIRVTLPPELSFWADGEALPERTFEWTQALRRGDNEIPIAIRGQRPGLYRVAVSAWIGEEQVKDEVMLEVVRG